MQITDHKLFPHNPLGNTHGLHHTNRARTTSVKLFVPTVLICPSFSFCLPLAALSLFPPLSLSISVSSPLSCHSVTMSVWFFIPTFLVPSCSNFFLLFAFCFPWLCLAVSLLLLLHFFLARCLLPRSCPSTAVSTCTQQVCHAPTFTYLHLAAPRSSATAAALLQIPALVLALCDDCASHSRAQEGT